MKGVLLSFLIAVCATLAASQVTFTGRWVSHYPTKDCNDLISIAQTGPVVNATKITGTIAVPAGKTTFIVKMQNSTLGTGDGQMAQDGYVNPYWAPVLLLVQNADWFRIVDDPSRPCPGPGRWPGQDFHKYYDTCKAETSLPMSKSFST